MKMSWVEKKSTNEQSGGGGGSGWVMIIGDSRVLQLCRGVFGIVRKEKSVQILLHLEEK